MGTIPAGRTRTLEEFRRRYRMRHVIVRLQTLGPGVIVVSDVVDSLGRLLAKAPMTLDEGLKKALLSRGVKEVFIEDRRLSDRVESEQAIHNEIESVRKRLSLLGAGETSFDVKAIVLNTIEQFYKNKQ
jgi:hypothetical protein